MRGQIACWGGASSGNRRCRFFNRVEDAQGLGCTLKTRRTQQPTNSGVHQATQEPHPLRRPTTLPKTASVSIGKAPNARQGRRTRCQTGNCTTTPELWRARRAPHNRDRTPPPRAHTSAAPEQTETVRGASAGVQATRVSSLSPPGRSCLAARSAFPQQRKCECYLGRDRRAQHRSID
jgi:hypothetical protein